MDLLRTTAFILAASLASPAAMATVLYKSVAANGVVEFSDVPPADNSKLVEEREIGARPVVASGAASAVNMAAATVMQSTPLASMETLISDGVVARASEKVDLAEHALAMARRDLWSTHDGLHLKGSGHTAADEERVAYFKRGVLAARQALMDTLRERLASR